MRTPKTIYRKYLLLVALPLLVTAGGALIFHTFVLHAIRTNVVLNGIILATAAIGAALMLHRIWSVRREWRLFESFAANDGDERYLESHANATRLLGHLASARTRRRVTAVEQTQIQEELEDVRRVLESRQEVAQYVVGLMIALGLLGTFIGLLETLVAVGDLIGGFANAGQIADLDSALTKLVGNLQYPLSAMGMAFSASMFGLLGSLTLGLMMLSVRAFQTDFLQSARSVVDQVTAGLLVAPAAAATPGADPEIHALWDHRMAELQDSQQAINDHLQELAAQSRANEDRQRVLGTTMERVLLLLEDGERRSTDAAAHLAALPGLFSAVEQAGRTVSLWMETMSQENRLAEVQRQAFAKDLVENMIGFSSRIDRSLQDEARASRVALEELIDQRLASQQKDSERAQDDQRSAVAQRDLQQQMLAAFSETSLSMSSVIKDLRESADRHSQAVRDLMQTVAKSAEDERVRGERVLATLSSMGIGDAETKLVREVVRATERLEREVRVGISAVLATQREVLRDTQADPA